MFVSANDKRIGNHHADFFDRSHAPLCSKMPRQTVSVNYAEVFMPIIIGIAGGSASGKSTFTDTLANRLSDIRTAVFHMDSYFKSHDELPRSVSPVSGKVYADYNLPESFELQRLRDDLANVIDADTVIVEGLFTLWDDTLCRLLDMKLFVDCRADERIVRRLRRNMTYGMSFDEIAEVYLDLVRFRHDEFVEPSRSRADLIINGSADFDSPAGIVAEHIRQLLKLSGKYS